VRPSRFSRGAKIDLVLTDLDAGDGVELARTIRSRWPQLAGLVTGWATKGWTACRLGTDRRDDREAGQPDALEALIVRARGRLKPTIAKWEMAGHRQPKGCRSAPQAAVRESSMDGKPAAHSRSRTVSTWGR
jgi:hypothetical protein